MLDRGSVAARVAPLVRSTPRGGAARFPRPRRCLRTPRGRSGGAAAAPRLDPGPGTAPPPLEGSVRRGVSGRRCHTAHQAARRVCPARSVRCRTARSHSGPGRGAAPGTGTAPLPPAAAITPAQDATLARAAPHPALLRLRGAELSRERRGRFPGDAGGAGAAIMAAAAAVPRRGRLGREARASLAAFLLGASVAALPVALGSPTALLAAPGLRGRLALALHVAGVNAALLLLYPRPLYKVRGRPPGGGAAGEPLGGRRLRGAGSGGRPPWGPGPGLGGSGSGSDPSRPLLADRRPGLFPGLRLRLRAAAERRPLRLAPLRLVSEGLRQPGGRGAPRPCRAFPPVLPPAAGTCAPSPSSTTRSIW